MALQLPEYSTSNFESLRNDLIASIPKYTKEWTNFNHSDPGIILLELLAWVSEALIYRTNRIPVASYIGFLRLITGTTLDAEGKFTYEIYDASDSHLAGIVAYMEELQDSTSEIGPEDIQIMKANAQKFLNSRYRAVIEEDFKELTLEASDKIRKVFVFEKGNRIEIVPVTDPENETESLVDTIKVYLDKRRLIGTDIRVRFPEYREVKLKIRIACKSYVDVGVTKENIRQEVFRYFDPVEGGPDGSGWEFGRNVMVYELFQIVGRNEGVEHVVGIFDIADGEEASFVQIDINEFPRLDSVDDLVVEAVETDEQ